MVLIFAEVDEGVHASEVEQAPDDWLRSRDLEIVPVHGKPLARCAAGR
jgi:hypothetical protein